MFDEPVATRSRTTTGSPHVKAESRLFMLAQMSPASSGKDVRGPPSPLALDPLDAATQSPKHTEIDSARLAQEPRTPDGRAQVANPLGYMTTDEWLEIKKTIRRHNSQKFQRWCVFEYFYAAVDRPYFMQEEFSQCMVHCGFGEVKTLPRRAWTFVRKKMGKPRRLSRNFLAAERQKLRLYRSRARVSQSQQGMSSASRLREGQVVTVLLPESMQFHQGTVLSCLELQSVSSDSEGSTPHYQIRLDDNIVSVVIVPDTDLMPLQSEFSASRLAEWSTPARLAVTDQPPFPHSSKDIHLVATLLRLLDRKKALVDHLHKMNIVAQLVREKSRPAGAQPERRQGPVYVPVPRTFRQQYAWVIVELERTSSRLEAALLTLRSRRVKSRKTEEMPSTPAQAMGKPLPKNEAECRAEAADFVSELVARMRTRSELPKTSCLLSETGTRITQVIVSCVSLFMMLKHCVEGTMPLSQLTPALDALTPDMPENQRFVDHIIESVQWIRGAMSERNAQETEDRQASLGETDNPAA